MKLVLSLDGGGIRGIFSACVLEALEQVIGRPCGEAFDLIAGTSTGGILACGLASGVSISDLRDLYAKRGGEIFSKDPLEFAMNLLDSKYSPEPLERILAEVLHDHTLTDATTKLLVTAYAIELPHSAKSWAAPDSTRAPYVFKSWAGANAYLRDVARATSAAPTYFPPHEFTNLSGEKGAYVDGGVFANNPAMCAFAEAVRLWPQEDIAVISVGTGELEQPIPYSEAKRWGLAGWARPIISLLMDGSCDAVNYQLGQLIGDHYVRFDTSLGTDQDPWAASDSMDDASPDNIVRLTSLATRYLAAPIGVESLRSTGVLAAKRTARGSSSPGATIHDTPARG